MFKKFLIVLAVYTAGELSLAYRLNHIANSLAAANDGKRPVVLEPTSKLSSVLVKMTCEEDHTNLQFQHRFI